MNNILSKEEIEKIKVCGQILKNALDEVEATIRPDISTLYLDEIAENSLRKQGSYPAFKNFPGNGTNPFPASLCVSINEEIVHGIPTASRIIKEGDIVSVDLGAYYEGVYTDSARTFAVGEVSVKVRSLLETTKKCLYAGIKEARSGNHIGAIGHAIQQIAESSGYNVVRDLVGHGIGRNVHMDPNIPNYGSSKSGPIITEGMALAIEPMLVMGSYRIRVESDGWTITTADRSLSAHFEHTVVIINGKPVIVTQ